MHSKNALFESGWFKKLVRTSCVWLNLRFIFFHLLIVGISCLFLFSAVCCRAIIVNFKPNLITFRDADGENTSRGFCGKKTINMKISVRRKLFDVLVSDKRTMPTAFDRGTVIVGPAEWMGILQNDWQL